MIFTFKTKPKIEDFKIMMEESIIRSNKYIQGYIFPNVIIDGGKGKLEIRNRGTFFRISGSYESHLILMRCTEISECFALISEVIRRNDYDVLRDSHFILTPIMHMKDKRLLEVLSVYRDRKTITSNSRVTEEFFKNHPELNELEDDTGWKMPEDDKILVMKTGEDITEKINVFKYSRLVSVYKEEK